MFGADRPKIKLNSDIHSGNVMPVLEAINGNVASNIRAFETTPFVNGRAYGESTGRALTIEEMNELRIEIIRLVQDFNRIITGSNLSGEQLQLAKIVYIYNHILGNVCYADVLSANDGTARVQNRPEDAITPYESAYTALIKKQSICCGISDAVNLLCKTMGVECEKWLWSDGGHAFNKVKLGNAWYKLDATFQIGFYPRAKAEEWDTRYLLTATEQPLTNPNLSDRFIDYPRNQIQAMKSLLESRGVNFNYSPSPKITIRTTLEGLRNLVNDTNQTQDEQVIDISNLERIISEIDNSINPVPQITIHNRTDGIGTQLQEPIIHYVPTDKKITIQKVNYRINIISVNDNYVINTETSDNTQQTLITDNQGNISGMLRRGFNFIKGIFGLPTNERDNNSPEITIHNRTDGNSTENIHRRR